MNDYGYTALMIAATNGQAAVAAQLVEAGADATPRATGDEYEGMTALEIAEFEMAGGAEHEEVAALLRQRAELESRSGQ